MNAVKTKRGTIKQLLDRKTIYNVSDYARKTGKKIGRFVSKSEVLTALNHMEKEGQLEFSVNGNAIVGCTFKAIA